jgi:hypothetical protein
MNINATISFVLLFRPRLARRDDFFNNTYRKYQAACQGRKRGCVTLYMIAGYVRGRPVAASLAGR